MFSQASFLLIAASIVLLSSHIFPLALAAAGDSCSSTSLCSSDAPCCSSTGVCGSGSLFCAGGCNPLSSYSASSCLPNPICTNQTIVLSPDDYNKTSVFVPILQYDGNSSIAPFTLDSGSLAAGSEGVMAQLTAARQVKLSTTEYILYGEVSVKMRHNATQGLVATAIFMSDAKDEIDWECVGSTANDCQTNYFFMGITGSGSSTTDSSSSLDVNDWTTFAFDWQPDSLKWKIDGTTVRTLTKTTAGTDYPRTPSRLQISLWSGGNSTESEGVIEWAGGATDWDSTTYKELGYYGLELGGVNVTCAAQSVANLTTNGTGTDVTSWVYTGTNTSIGPEFYLSTDSITYLSKPSAGGVAGDPGWSTENTDIPEGGWDGSGDTGLVAATSSSSSSSSIKSKLLKYGVPAVAGVAGLILVWIAAIFLCRRCRRRDRGSIGNDYGTYGAKDLASAKEAGYTTNNLGRGNRSASGGKYTQLGGGRSAVADTMGAAVVRDGSRSKTAWDADDSDDEAKFDDGDGDGIPLNSTSKYTSSYGNAAPGGYGGSSYLDQPASKYSVGQYSPSYAPNYSNTKYADPYAAGRATNNATPATPRTPASLMPGSAAAYQASASRVGTATNPFSSTSQQSHQSHQQPPSQTQPQRQRYSAYDPRSAGGTRGAASAAGNLVSSFRQDQPQWQVAPTSGYRGDQSQQQHGDGNYGRGHSRGDSYSYSQGGGHGQNPTSSSSYGGGYAPQLQQQQQGSYYANGQYQNQNQNQNQNQSGYGYPQYR